MTENKRFQWVYIKDNSLELRDNGIVKIFNNERLEEFLNELSDENEQLKNEVYDWKASAEDYLKLGQSLKKENEQLKETIKELELENAKHIGDGEWDIRDITYRHGKFRLEEWDERYHQFYDDDKALEDEEAVSLLFENEQLKQDIEYLEKKIKENEWHWNTIDEDRDVWHYKYTEAEKRVEELKEKNKQLKERIKSLEREVQELSCGEADWLIEEML